MPALREAIKAEEERERAKERERELEAVEEAERAGGKGKGRAGGGGGADGKGKKKKGARGEGEKPDGRAGPRSENVVLQKSASYTCRLAPPPSFLSPCLPVCLGPMLV